MAITTSEKTINIIDAIHPNQFLKSLYPQGLANPILIGHLGFDLGNNFSLNLHTKQLPNKEIAKWGQSGRDYDVVVISLLGSLISDISISNWGSVDFAPLVCSIKNDGYFLESSREDWHVSFSFDVLIFQECRTYLSGA
jgi:hypothetical protein